MTETFAALQELGDTTRLRVFLALLGAKKNVSQITAELGLAQPQVSYHLRRLREAGLAVEEKDGRWVWYQANWESDDRNVRDFVDLMARWAEDAGVSEEGAPAETVSAMASHSRAERAGRRGRGVGVMRKGGGGVDVGCDDCGAGRRRPRPLPEPDEDDDRPTVERPKRRESDMEDFLL